MGCVQSSTGKSQHEKYKLKRDVYSPSKKKCSSHAAKVSKDFGLVSITPSDTSNLLGVARVRVQSAEFEKKGHYNMTLSLGMQSFLSKTSNRTKRPQFDAERNVVIMRSAHVMHLMVHRLKGNNLLKLQRKPVGVASIDLLELFPDFESTGSQCSKEITVSLRKPTASQLKEDMKRSIRGQETEASSQGAETDDPDPVIGTVSVVVNRTSIEQLEEAFWTGLIQIVDWDDSGTLDKEEFYRLMHEILATDEDGADNQAKAVDYLWKLAEAEAGPNQDVNAEVLAKILSAQHQKHDIQIRRCPISGAKLHPTDTRMNLVYMLFQMNSGMGKNLQGGFRTAAQANRSWISGLTEWVMEPAAGNYSGLFKGTSYELGLNNRGNAAHIVVYDRKRQILEEEIISPLVVLAMRNMYQSTFGILMKATGMYKHLNDFSKQMGVKMDDPASKASIRKFVKAYRGQLDISEIDGDLDSFETFNEFFYRRLKEGSRPISHHEDDSVFVSAADCRLMAFDDVDQAKQFWIKGRLFTIAGLLASEELGKQYESSSLLVFRLAPQDYHRFHSPVTGIIKSIVEIPGHLYTVNPIAVNSPMVNVLTENKRVRVHIETEHFGDVQFVAIGATAVGSIRFTVKEGSKVRKGDEVGYFAFGGSTIITLVPKGLLSLDGDVHYLSSKSVETYVRMGTQLGVTMLEKSTSCVKTGALPSNILEVADLHSTAVRENFRRLATIQMESSKTSGSAVAEKYSAGSKWDVVRATVTQRNQEFLTNLLKSDSDTADDSEVELETQQTVLVEE